MYTFKQLVIDVLIDAEKPLSRAEIWERGIALRLVDKLESQGKTPSQSLGAVIYTDMKSDKPSFAQVSSRPALFVLKSKQDIYTAESIQEYQNNTEHENINKITKNIQPHKKSPFERDLHLLLSSFVYYSPHFKCYTKTIYHEKSIKRRSGSDIWVYPDIVGVYYPYHDYRKETLRFKAAMEEKIIKLFSFELKTRLEQATFRKYFFQAVSNSSWAHEGYLVALEIEDDIKEDLRKLNTAFGIGIIQLNAQNIHQSEIVFSSHEKYQIDYEAIDRLVEHNIDFKEFIQDITIDSKEFYNNLRGRYDTYLDEEEIRAYSIEKGIL